MKNIVCIEIEDVSFNVVDIFNDTIKSIINKLRKLEKKYKDRYIDIAISVETDYDGYKFYLEGMREETDGEYTFRLEQEEKIRVWEEEKLLEAKERQDLAIKRRTENELALYLTLHEKYGKNPNG